MKKEKVKIIIELIIVYSIVLGMTALPLLFNIMAQRDVGRLYCKCLI